MLQIVRDHFLDVKVDDDAIRVYVLVCLWVIFNALLPQHFVYSFNGCLLPGGEVFIGELLG